MIGFGNLENSLSWAPLSMAMGLIAAGRSDPQDVMTGKTLKKLFKGMQVTAFRGEGKARVSCLISDSRRVVRGAVFFAVEGLHKDGNAFLEEAIDRGAVAVVSSAKPPVLCPITYIQVPDVRRALADVSRIFFEAPDEALNVVGITGTNGKTTVSMLVQALLAEESVPVGLIGTVRYDLGGRTLPSYRTTPESVDLFAMLSQMRDAGCKEAVMEVSSHGLEQSRVYGLNFEAVAFLNLTQDHIDYHGTMEAYFEAKARLFNGKVGNLPKVAILNLDDPKSLELQAIIPSKVKVRTFSIKGPADFYVRDLQLLPASSVFTLMYPEGEVEMNLPLPGLFNVENSLAAIALCHGLGRDVKGLVQKLGLFKGVPGRMERVNAGQAYNVFVDYAHTDDALRQALAMLRCVTPGKVYTVFGCGGDRDRSKRPQMMQAVLDNADQAWVTADNPRSEKVEAIFEDMKQGVAGLEKATFVTDRREAIGLALKAAQPGDCVLIAGKGHEAYQEFADTVVPFDDVRVAKDWIFGGVVA